MTRQELYEKVLQKLGVIAAGESAAPEDTQLVEARYTSLYNLLNADDLTPWTGTGGLPDYGEIPVTTMLACHCAREFGVVGQRYAELLAEGGFQLPQTSWAERQLRRVVAKKYVATRAQSEYY